MNKKTSIHASLASVVAAPSCPLRHPRSRLPLGLAVTAAALLLCHALSSRAQTWNLAGGGSWNVAGNWNPASIPNAVGANATFNNSSPAQTANRTVTADAAQTVGSITFNPNAAVAFTTTVSIGTAGSITFDETGAGPATLAFPAARFQV